METGLSETAGFDGMTGWAVDWAGMPRSLGAGDLEWEQTILPFQLHVQAFGFFNSCQKAMRSGPGCRGKCNCEAGLSYEICQTKVQPVG